LQRHIYCASNQCSRPNCCCLIGYLQTENGYSTKVITALMSKHSPDHDSQSSVVKHGGDPVSWADMVYEEAPSSSSILYLALKAYITQVSLGNSHLEDSFRHATMAKAHVPDLREWPRFGAQVFRTAACVRHGRSKRRSEREVLICISGSTLVEVIMYKIVIFVTKAESRKPDHLAPATRHLTRQ
jgi:hypothetical protein